MEDLFFYDENIPCLAGCPVHTNAGAYVAAITDGDDLGAYLIARLPNPFASVCGRVCAAPCEDVCRRGVIDRPIAIQALKRFVTEQYGVEAHMDVWKRVAPAPNVELSQSVGIVGGGPAGLACAHDLRLRGYQVTVYEAADRLGGMMVLGIPEYRLDRELLDAEIAAVVDLGVEVELGTRLGQDVTLTDLRARHDAVFLALGATLGRGLDLEGNDADGVLSAIEFLLNVNQGFRVEPGSQVVVVGGGDEAMDAARSALRAGAAEVTVMSLESRDEMPADEFEIEEAENEGVRFLPRRGPSRILTENGQVVGIETTGVVSVYDEQGRFPVGAELRLVSRPRRRGDRRARAQLPTVLEHGQRRTGGVARRSSLMASPAHPCRRGHWTSGVRSPPNRSPPSPCTSVRGRPTPPTGPTGELRLLRLARIMTKKEATIRTSKRRLSRTATTRSRTRRRPRSPLTIERPRKRQLRPRPNSSALLALAAMAPNSVAVRDRRSTQRRIRSLSLTST